MHWHLVVLGELIVGATALFCVLNDKNPVRLLVGATTGAAVTASLLAAVAVIVGHLPPERGWLPLVFTSLGLGAGLLGGTAMGAFAGAAIVALLEGPSPARSTSYVGALLGLVAAAVPVVFLQQTWPEEVRNVIVVALICQGLIAGALLGRGIGMKHAV